MGLALAWAKDEISMAQIKKTLKIKEGNKVYSILARGLKMEIRSSFGKRNPDGQPKAPEIDLAQKQTPPVEVVVPNKNIKQIAHEQKSSKDSAGLGDIAPGAY